LIAAGSALGLALILGGAWAFEGRRYRVDLAEARRELGAGRYLVARRSLIDLSGRIGRSDEVLLALGDCEQALGRPDLAASEWSRVAANSPWGAEAGARLARAAMAKGRFAEAEDRLIPAVAASGPARTPARDTLILLYRFEGRLAEVRDLIRGWSTASASPLEPLRELFDLDFSAYPIEGVRSYLADAARKAPDDDRVWLALANLATRLGDFAAASDRLDACLGRRPDDPAVWRSRLDWAIAGDRPAEAVRALPHLQAWSFTRADLLEIRAWLAARSGDPALERRALEDQVGTQLRRTGPIDRLIEVCVKQGDPKPVAPLRARRAEFERDLGRYRTLLGSDDAARHGAELAGLARRVGRPFDAHCWLAVASKEEGGMVRSRSAEASLEAETLPIARDESAAEFLADVVAAFGRAKGPAPPETSAPAMPEFVDEAEASGLRFRYDNGRSPARHLPETMGGGVALLDYDGDGRLDVFLPQGGAFPPDPANRANGDKLFRNRGDGTFEDATGRSGLSGFPGGYGHGSAVGDVDNDGHADLFVARWRSYALYRNRGDGTFEDATDRLGLGGDRDWPTSAAFADLDNDGDLDLYVCHYLAWDPAAPSPCEPKPGKPRYYCDPHLLKALPDHVFRNDGGRFVDVSRETGLDDREGRGLGVVVADLDDDGRVDLFVANDTTANALWHNLGGFRFEEVAAASGVAANGSGAMQAGMGIACGDQDGDGRPDLAVTNFFAEGITLFANLGGNVFADHSASSGLLAASRNDLGFGVAFLDANDDGRLDLATANGHVNDGRPRLPYAMPARLWLGQGRGRMVDASDKAGPPWKVPRLGRGLATGDLDNDGRVDLLIVAEGEPLAYFRNTSKGTGRSLTLRLEGSSSNRDAVGAKVVVVAGGRRQVAQRTGGGSYLSAPDPRLRFGLGPAGRAESVEVTWPSGRVDRWVDLASGRGYRLREGDPEPAPLPGFPGP